MADFHSVEKLRWGIDVPKLGQVDNKFQNSSIIVSQEIQLYNMDYLMI